MVSIVNMKYDNMMRMTKHLKEKNFYLEDSIELIFDFSSLNFIEPAGAIILLSTIDRLKEDDIAHKLESIENLNRDAISYGETMGIFQKLGLSDARSFSRGPNYIAPAKIVLTELFDSLQSQSKTIETYYDEISSDIVTKMLKDFGKDSEEEVKNLFEFVVREMIRNIFDHSQTKQFYYGSQFYPATNSVEVAIADLGVGLVKTVPFDIEESWFGQPTDEDAIKKAMIPGLSALSNHAYAPEDYKNSGYGLALVRRIVEKTNGYFSIASGNKAITYSLSEESVEDCDITGTLIRMRINVENLNNINFEEILEEAKKEASSKGYNDSPSSASKRLKSQMSEKL